ncbi:hypothetical protein M6B38_326095 [Iris pallida]|uniref:Uncharacterized protein n=1 Tax=Iris pallida TaxID=29817 RepID=A0AAX6GGL8_IRIPA|nr:hypothetical protein M6B38_156660 [Iris pallida]KAJ6813913.1 hypothetical protein M6B38_143310 [Iris pallida]KAJ6818911.1 hypothetical protein M6B38_404260 [Iris pallida]KAJ6827437.1 hypothetical protein M6B38_368745 [Iris pallida]KAJ6828809.1 hypothetical protein M6B38_361350 [Iris pallida]
MIKISFPVGLESNQSVPH